MAKRRVFRTRVQCPGISADLGPTANQHAMVGRVVTFKRAPDFEVDLILDDAVVGRLDAPIGTKVATAIDRGQVFTAVIEKAFPSYNDNFKQNGAHFDIKVEYLLEKGQPAIETEKYWRSVESPDELRQSTSFFTKVAGVTFEGRQRIVARCSVGERLTLIRDPNDRYDQGAIKVLRSNGEQLGFIPSDVSRGGDPSGLAFRMDRGDKYQCRIKNLTGGDGYNLGVNIEVLAGEEFDDVPSIPLLQDAETPSASGVESAYSNLRWLLPVAVLLVVVVVWMVYWL
jgi:hypothetical protein